MITTRCQTRLQPGGKTLNGIQEHYTDIQISQKVSKNVCIPRVYELQFHFRLKNFVVEGGSDDQEFFLNFHFINLRCFKIGF